MNSKRLVFFGGQGSRSIFSSGSTSQADTQNDPAAVSLLLSTCYTAFLGEVIRAQLRDSIPTWADFDVPSSPHLLLNVPSAHSDNPILQGVCLCVNQLVGYLRHDTTLESLKQTTPIGFCSGMLPALVLACSTTVDEYIQLSGEVVRLAFWIGYRAAELSQQLSEDWQAQPWALSISEKDKDHIMTEVEEFNRSVPESSMIQVSSRFGKASFSLVGPGHALKAFKSQYVSKPSTAEFVHVHALYHGGEKASRALSYVLEDVKRGDISIPSSIAMKRPIWSCRDACMIDAVTLKSSSLLEYALRLILVDTADLYNTWRSAVGYIDSSDHDWEIVTVGPGSNALLASVCKDIPYPAGTGWIDIPGTHPGANAPQMDGFAIVGMSVDFPSGAGKDEFWKMLETGLNAQQEIPNTRFEVNDYIAGNRNCRPPREMKATHGNFVNDPFQFDHEYFGISPREAKSMDPQQKMLLRGAVHAMDDAGYVPNGAPTFTPETMGCYIGVATDDYVQNLQRNVDVYYSTGTLRAFLSGKLSYAFGWSGPSIVIDTACSSSLVSIVMACRALAQGDCTTVLAGGVNAITSPDMYLGLSRAHFLSPTGQCKPFDVSADGYCRAEGCGLFVLKRLSDAVREGDRIYGVIKEAEMNQSGNSSSITHPHGRTQEQLFERLLARRNIDPKSIDVIEAHGTGTQAGDGIETSSIGSTFGGSHRPVYLTSVKGNIGHAEAASGAAGLAKLLMMLKFSKIPPQVGFNTLNPKLQNLAGRNIRIPTELSEWNRMAPNVPRRALLNNFGAAGSNAALIIDEYRMSPRRKDHKFTQRAAYNLVLSARNSRALHELIEKYLVLFRETDAAIQDICYTTTARRQKHQHIFSIVGGTLPELVDQLEKSKEIETSLVNYGKKRPIVFVFSGQGSFHDGMGQQLMLTAPVFKAKVQECDRLLEQNGFGDFVPSKSLDGSFSPDNAQDWVLWSQIACFTLEYALACLWMSYNIHPDVVIGHSLGEYVAMVISGSLSLQDALLLIIQRAQLMSSTCKVGETTMLACNESAVSITHIIEHSGLSQLSLACDNSSADSVVSGPVKQVEQLALLLKEKGARCKVLNVPLGFHSSALDSIIPELKTQCETLRFRTPKIPLGSCFHGRFIQEGDLNPSYPIQQTRGAVRFTELIDLLYQQDQMQQATFIEVGPCPITLPMIRAKFSGQDTVLLPSITKGQDPWITMSRALQQMSLRYNSIQWRNVFDGTGAKVVDLPDYPFQMQSLYVPFEEPVVEKAISSTIQAPKPKIFRLLQSVVDCDMGKGISTFSTTLDSLSEYIEGHSVDGFPLCPASVYHEMVLEAMHYEDLPSQDLLAVVSDITFGHPLVYSPETKDSTVLLTLAKSVVGIPESEGRFTFTFPGSRAGDPEVVLCSGRTAWMSFTNAKAFLGRKAAYAKRQIKLLSANSNQTNTLRRNVIYNIIFPRVVAYSEAYQSITQLHVSEAELDGYGTFEIPVSTLEGGIMSPVFIDTLLHAAGFVANSQAKPTDAFICSKVESTVVQYTDIIPQDTFRVYCSLLDCGNGERIGEAFAMTLDGKMVASIEGMIFKRLNIRSFASHLARQAGQRSNGDVPRPFVPAVQTKVSKTTTRTSVSQFVDSGRTVVNLITNLCGQPQDMITPDKRLADLGIDSLMQIELAQSIKTQFPHLDTDSFMNLETVRDIQDCIASARGPTEMSSAHEEFSNSSSSSDNSDDIPSTISTSNFTPYAELNSSTSDILDLLVQLVGETWGFDPSDVQPDMIFEAFGMDSLMAIEFQEVLQKRFGKNLAHEFSSPKLTIGDLAEILAADVSLPSTEVPTDLIKEATTKVRSSGIPKEECIVHLQKGPDSSYPLILIHDGSGLIEKYKRLPKLGCNLFGIRNPELSAQAHWASNMHDMARRYATSIASTVKTKQVVLGGWSFGGVLAHEVAQHLDKMGLTTVAVILIDSPVPLDHQPLPSEIVNHVLNPKKLPQSVLETLSFQFTSHASFLAGYDIQHPIPTGRKYAVLHSEQAINTTHLCGVSYPWLESQQYRASAIRQWEGLLGRSLAVYDIPGNHFEPFNDENIEAVAEKLKFAYGKVTAF